MEIEWQYGGAASAMSTYDTPDFASMGRGYYVRKYFFLD